MAKYIRKVHNVDHHRNGIAGNGFYLVRFSGDDPNEQNMIGLVFDKDDSEHPKPDGYVAVLSLDNLDECWRGDNFEDELMQAAKEWKDSGRRLYGPTLYSRAVDAQNAKNENGGG